MSKSKIAGILLLFAIAGYLYDLGILWYVLGILVGGAALYVVLFRWPKNPFDNDGDL